MACHPTTYTREGSKGKMGSTGECPQSSSLLLLLLLLLLYQRYESSFYY